MLLETKLAGLGVPKKGKVRDIYDLDDTLLIVATDRVSAFDVVLPTGIPDKGKVLNQLSLFWFRAMGMIVRKAKPFPAECVVRGYLAGSGWTEYREKGTVCGVRLPADLRESERLPESIFTPTTKAETGHDEAVSMEQLRELLGDRQAEELKSLSIMIYNRAAAFAETKGILIADTKFEFGIADGETILIDEALTPDSSRFWSAKDYKPGKGQDSFDKQIVRDYLNTLDWDKTYPGPGLPPEIIEKTAGRYREIFEILTESPLR
ncbi:MAG: phosphoribosylaminoimidazolesuccinocarboxamide synthase [Syntrophorhabdales bacterium]